MVLESQSLAPRVSVTFSDTVLQLYLQLIKKKNPHGSHKTLSTGGVAHGLTDEHVLANLTYEGHGTCGRTDDTESCVSKRVLESILDLQS